MSALQPPSINSSLPTLADWMELQALCSPRRAAHDHDLIAIIQVVEDDEDDDEIASDSRAEELIDDVFAELERRMAAAEDRYPFLVSNSGTTLSLEISGGDYACYAYLFCLLVSEHRRQELVPRWVFSPIAGKVEDLFQVCSTVAAAGLLNGCATSFGFPRPDNSGFLAALTRTFEDRMREGRIERIPRAGVSSATKDGGIDIVAWSNFPDGLPSKLYLLGQCASGAKYPDKSVGAYIRSFHEDWFTTVPGSTPLEAMFIPFMLDSRLTARKRETLGEARQGHYLSQARTLGVIVDRCRLAYLVKDGMSVEQRRPSSVERVGEMSLVEDWVNTAIRSLTSAT